ncbi:hypothetical protein SASPL_119348 [Salvia splendens]|uniref:Uncharacterized protein n=1 Tax=Salvia splendens TaxID=180675 RepID=A0A8X8XTE9_SALSN|nr:hypothetical protein SASPL_119348 [Salvia splendens]
MVDIGPINGRKWIENLDSHGWFLWMEKKRMEMISEAQKDGGHRSHKRAKYEAILREFGAHKRAKDCSNNHLEVLMLRL